MKLIDLVQPDAIIADLDGKERTAAIRELVGALAQSGQLAAEIADTTVKSIVARERSRTRRYDRVE